MPPRYPHDLFAPDALRDPFPHYRAIRDLGPVVRLGDTGIYAIARFSDVQSALRAADVFVSGKGIGFNEATNSRPPAIINSDGDRHRRVRGQLVKPLMPAALTPHRRQLKDLISRRISEVRGRGWIDGISQLAMHLPVGAVSHMVGLPEEGRENMLRWASAGFNSIGPQREELAEDFALISEARSYIFGVERDRLAPGSFADKLFKAVDEGRLAEGEARAALSGYVLPSLDTTIYAQGNLLYNLGRNADQWRMLKSDMSLVPGAVIESVRHSAVVRWFSRVAIEDHAINGVSIPAGTRVMLIYGSANRDERRFADPDRFDIRRDARDQLGWGTGPHICAGMHLAKLEMEVLLEALVEQVDAIEVGEPTVGANQGLYGFDNLPLRLL